MTVLFAAVLLWAQSAEEWRRAGLDRISKGELKEAAADLKKACASESKGGDSCYYFGRTLNMLGQFEDSRKAFELALTRARGEFAARVYRGAALNFVALGDDAEADRHFRQAIESAGPGPEDPRVDYGAFLFRQGKTAEASKQLSAAVSANPESARANLEYGRVLLQLGQLEAAVKRLEVATRRNPADANAHLLLGRAYQRLGRDADAERELKLGESEWRRKQQP